MKAISLPNVSRSRIDRLQIRTLPPDAPPKRFRRQTGSPCRGDAIRNPGEECQVDAVSNPRVAAVSSSPLRDSLSGSIASTVFAV